MIKITSLVLSAAVIASGMVAQSAMADNYPSRPVTLVIGYPAGGGTDIQARVLAPFIEKHLGVPVVVENRPGASGLVGASFLANAEPDGYTIGALNFPSMYAPIYSGTATYKADAFTPLANQIGGNIVLTANPSSDIKSVEDFLAAAKEKPIVVGVTGVGHPSQLSAILFEQLTGVDLNFVPFNGGGPARVAMLGNHVTLGFMNEVEIFGDHRKGDLNMIASTGSQRSTLSPDVPTFKELGYDLEFSLMSGFGAPAGLPDDIEAKLTKAFEDALKDPEYLAAAKDRELSTEPLSQADFATALERGNKYLGELWEISPWSN